MAHKFGWFISGSQRIQRYRCKQCGKTFGDIPERPLDSLRTPLEDAARVVHLLCEGVGIRATSRLSGLDKHTVLSILETVGAKCARLLDRKVQWLHVRHVQIDELWAYVFCKQRKSRDDTERGDQYTYLAFDTDTKLILAHTVGKRDRETARPFLEDVRKRVNNRCQVSTDGFSAYGGYEGAVFRAFKQDVDFGVVVKLYSIPPAQGPSRYSPGQCMGVRKEVQIGSLELKDICTSHVERQNLNMRLFNRRMTRLTLGYSKKVRNLRYAVALQIAYHNFCRVHAGLKGDKKTSTQTPAMAAKLTDHIWTIAELLKA
jgi:IS1 family transposase